MYQLATNFPFLHPWRFYFSKRAACLGHNLTKPMWRSYEAKQQNPLLQFHDDQHIAQIFNETSIWWQNKVQVCKFGIFYVLWKISVLRTPPISYRRFYFFGLGFGKKVYLKWNCEMKKNMKRWYTFQQYSNGYEEVLRENQR